MRFEFPEIHEAQALLFSRAVATAVIADMLEVSLSGWLGEGGLAGRYGGGTSRDFEWLSRQGKIRARAG